MKIAISSNDGSPHSPFSSRFGRCSNFAFFDTETQSWDKAENPARSSRGGAGTQLVQYLADQGVEVLISGRYGPNAFLAIQASGIDAYLGKTGTPTDLVEKFQSGILPKATGPSGPGYHGGEH